MFRVCHAVLSVYCSLVITCWQRAYLLVLMYVMFSYVLVTLPCGVLGQVWYLIVSILDFCLLPFFAMSMSLKYVGQDDTIRRVAEFNMRLTF